MAHCSRHLVGRFAWTLALRKCCQIASVCFDLKLMKIGKDFIRLFARCHVGHYGVKTWNTSNTIEKRLKYRQAQNGPLQLQLKLVSFNILALYFQWKTRNSSACLPWQVRHSNYQCKASTKQSWSSVPKMDAYITFMICILILKLKSIKGFIVNGKYC